MYTMNKPKTFLGKHHKKNDNNSSSSRPVTMEDVADMVNLVEGKMAESNKTRAALAKSAGNEMARHGRKLFFSNGVSKVTDEATYQTCQIAYKATIVRISHQSVNKNPRLDRHQQYQYA